MWEWFTGLPGVVQGFIALGVAFTAGQFAAGWTFVSEAELEQAVAPIQTNAQSISALEVRVTSNRAEMDGLRRAIEDIRGLVERIDENQQRMEYNQCLLLVEVRGDQNQDRCFR